MKTLKLKKNISQIFRAASLIVCIVLLLPSVTVFAQTFDQNDLNSIIEGTPFYDPTDNTQNCSATTPNGNVPSSSYTSGSWTSGLNPPYYLEAFAIQVLEDVAHKMGVPQSQTVTQEHVDALVAWFWIEGGDINDGPPNQANDPYPELFNPLNTSIQDPAIETTNGPGGVESFLSFDDGVEGNARTMVGPYQNRIANVLINPSTTAEQVMQTIANYQNFPGNLAWAFGPNPNDPASVEKFNQTVYLPSLLGSLAQLRTNYVSEASTEMGTPDAEAFIPSDKVPASDLQYTGGSSNPPGSFTDTSGCNGNSGANCTSSSTTAAGLSPIRQKVVCLAETQYQLWHTGKTAIATGLFPYTQGTNQEWCADFVSWVYNQAGDPLTPDPNWRITTVTTGDPSITTVPSVNTKFQLHSSPYVPQPGDLAIIPDQHVEMVVAVNGSSFTQIGGDEGSVANPPDGYGGDPGGNPVPNESQVLESVVDGFYSSGITYYLSPD